MSDSATTKKEIRKLVAETLQELGSVSHTVPGTAPVHSGLPNLPVSALALEFLHAKASKSYYLLQRASRNLDLVLSDLQIEEEGPGELQLVSDKIKEAMRGMEQYLHKKQE